MGLLNIIGKVSDCSNGGQNLPWISRRVMALLSGYNHHKYWTRRSIVVNPSNRTNILLKLYYLFYIKRVDAKHHCSFGTYLNHGAFFATPPFLPHGPNGIIVGNGVSLGKGVILYHQVTIAGGATTIGDHVEFGAGAKVIPDVHIGSHVHVGANAIVIEDIPDYATVVLQRPRIILKDKNE